MNGLLIRVQKLEEQNEEKDQKIKHMEETQKRLLDMITENKRLSQDLVTAQGLIQKYNQKIQVMEKKILDLTCRGMEQNIVIHGMDEHLHPAKENCSRAVQDFLHNFLQVSLEDSDIWKSYRFGKQSKDKARPTFVKLSHKAKDLVKEILES